MTQVEKDWANRRRPEYQKSNIFNIYTVLMQIK